MAIKIICIGKKHEDWVRSGVDRYQKRLKKPFDLEWTLLPHALSDEQAARRDESSEIMKKLSDSAFVILLDERGKSYSSPQFTDILLQSLDYSRPVVIVIGGAYGVDKTLHDRADMTLSFSSLVFPHQLVRLMITEQLYRAQEIAAGRPYHHS